MMMATPLAHVAPSSTRVRSINLWMYFVNGTELNVLGPEMLNAAYANKKDDLQKYDRRKKVLPLNSVCHMANESSQWASSWW